MRTDCINKPFEIENRRYIGCKAKLSKWIMQTIQENTKEVASFCDLFAGTGVISKYALALNLYDEVVINDFLSSNNIIYQAFFAHGKWDADKLTEISNAYNALKDDNLKGNWFSLNYGGKYFDEITARRIGYIREHLNGLQKQLTKKEYAILLASLIYSIDRLANTVGHFESYFRKPILRKNMMFQLVNAQSCDKVKMYQEDANALARKIKADVVYIDPPYNSRQYSRFYHVYETLVKWNKSQLYGAALKPKPCDMSEYCRSGAFKTFEDLIRTIDAKYVAVSYNNTYKSKSHSSENKIRTEQIVEVLKKKARQQYSRMIITLSMRAKQT